MPSYRNNHFVPKVYLKNFVIPDRESCLFRLRINVKDENIYEKLIIRERAISRIAFGENFYQIKKPTTQIDFGLFDSKIAEKSSFYYENSKLHEIISQFKEKTKSLDFEDFREFLEIIINLKTRGIKFRESLSKIYPKLNEVYSENLNKSLQGVIEIVGIPKSFLLDYLNFEFRHNEENVSDLHVIGLLESIKGNNIIVNQVLNYLSNADVFIFQTGEDRPFITSDSPGFVFGIDDSVSDLGFRKMKTFYLPLTKKICLGLIVRATFENNREKVSIHYSNIEDDHLKAINLFTAQTCFQDVFSNSKEALEEIKNLFLNLKSN